MASLWLACDTSGSMVEGGKRLITRGLVRQIEQYFRFEYEEDVELRLAAWSDDIRPCAWNRDEEFPEELLECRGAASGDALVAFVDAHSGESFVLITDGFWSSSSLSTIRSLREKVGPEVLRILKTGLDANMSLRGADVFTSEEVLSLLSGWPAS